MISRSKLGALVLGAFLALFIALTAHRGVIFLLDADPIARMIGAAFLLMAVIGVWAMVHEFRFGAGVERLGRELEAQGGLPEEELPLMPSGRVDRTAADGVFDRYREAVEAEPEDWRAWFRLGCVYDAARDRRRARAAMRRALRLHAP